ncbi:MAG: replicative DNA helicase [Candidatus Melainabacteria bacterium]|nr:replicative DNA helicase [Candidatus Melainabacteria bacterium]
MSSELNESSLERLPPQSLEAEQAVLGALLVSGDGASRIVDILNPEHFYRKAHMVIFAAVLDLYEANEPIDIITVCQFLKDQGNLDMVGGRQYILDLSLSVATTANLEYYARLVSEKAILRQLIKAGTEIVGSCYEETDADTALDRAEHMIFTLAQKREMQALVHVKHVVETSFQQIEARYENRDSLSGIPSGFYDLDAMTSGFQKSDLVIIAARPSMGKCLAWDSEIVLADGSVATIEEIYKSRRSKIFTLGDDYKLQLTEPSHFVDDGIKPVYRVTTRLGRSIETTLAHPFLTELGWQKLEHIQVGDRIAVPSHIPVFGTKELRDCEVKLIALLAADGILKRGEVSFTNFNPLLQQDFNEAVVELLRGPVLAKVVGDTSYGGTGSSRKVGLSPSPRPTWMGNSPVATWRESVGLPVGGSPSEIPASVFTLPRRQLALFLNRLFAASSRVSIDEEGNLQIAYASSSERLVKQLQHLLLRFGILSSVNRKIRFIERRKQWFQLDILDSDSVERFGTEIGIFGVEELKPDSSKSASSAEKFKTDIYWDEIISIETISCKQVYDLTIPETHNFVSNDICVHNTAFVLNVAQAAAMENNTPVAIFSLEMSKESLVMRMLCSTAEIDSNRLRTGHMHTSDWTKLAGAMGRIGEAPIFIDDSAMVNALEIRAKCRRLKAENHGLGMVIIDYIQLMQGRKQTDNRVQEVSEISRSLKQLAREIEVPVLALSQLSRAVEARQNKRPMLSDLRESGSIEQDADLVMFIYRDEYYNPETDKRGEAEIIIAKQRNGPVGTAELLYQGSITRFLNKVHTQYNQV